ncbi:hypothetical protein ACIA5D_08095 [Actinoplanes sp. NPDC051513]|uniref:hypothetical protein n=1 Tax=Actinoplanes sp. NPDC051513 TaxID=3363908 RepID=UPI0037916605
MRPDDAPPLQLIVVEGGSWCDPETGVCAPADKQLLDRASEPANAPVEAAEADPRAEA